MAFVRFESATPNRRGAHTGIFGLAMGLRSANRLSAADLEWLIITNAHGDAAYTNPGSVDPSIFDKTIHPLATCWFKASAVHLLAYATGYLQLLDRYCVAWRCRESEDPGHVLYQDDVQVVVVPHLRR